MSLDVHLAKLTRGNRFFRSLRSVCYLLTLLAILNVGGQIWHEMGAAGGTATGIALGTVVTLGIGLIGALPFLLIALGLRHLENLFSAVHDALDELRTTV